MKDYIEEFKEDYYWTGYGYETEISKIINFLNGTHHGTIRVSELGIRPVKQY